MSGSALDSVSPELRPVCHWSVAVIVIVGLPSGPVTQHAAHTLTPGNRISAVNDPYHRFHNRLKAPTSTFTFKTLRH